MGYLMGIDQRIFRTSSSEVHVMLCDKIHIVQKNEFVAVSQKKGDIFFYHAVIGVEKQDRWRTDNRRYY